MKHALFMCCSGLILGLAGTARAQRTSALLDPLPAAGPAASASAHDLYGGLVGDWDVAVTDYLADGSSRHGTGEWHFGWVLQGRALEDVWIAPRRGERPPVGEPPDAFNRYGLSIRFFDPAIDAWRVTWVNPVQNYVATLVGRASGRDIVQEGTGDDGKLLRWVFSEITPTSFLWRGDVSSDSGRTWQRVQEMSARRPPERAPAPPGPSGALMDALIADAPPGSAPHALALFGQFIGSWEGAVSGRNPDGTWTTGSGEIHFGWVLEGRAIQDVWIFPKRGTGKGATPADEYGSTIRLYDPSSGTWRIVWISPVNHVVRIFQARADGDEIFVEGTTARGQPQRWIFSQITPTSFNWRNIVSADGGRTWQLVERVDARPVSAQGTSAASVEVVLAFERAVCAAYERNDAAALDTLVADGYTLTDSKGVITTKSDDLRAARDREVEYSTFRNEGMTVRLFGNTAIVLGRTILKGRARDGSLVDVEVQFTDTLALIDGRWRLVAGHVSRLKPT